MFETSKRIKSVTYVDIEFSQRWTDSAAFYTVRPHHVWVQPVLIRPPTPFPDEFCAITYDLVRNLALAIGAVRAACDAPTNAVALMAAMRNVSFAGASGRVAWSRTVNDRVAPPASAPSPLMPEDDSPPSVLVTNAVDMNFREVRIRIIRDGCFSSPHCIFLLVVVFA